MKILVHVHDLPMWSLPDAQVERVRAALPGVEVVCVRDYDDAQRELRDADVAIAARMTPEALAGAARLRWVHSTAVGVSWLPLETLAERGIAVTNSRGVHAEMLAEHAVALLLALRRLLPEAEDARRARVWAQEALAIVPTPRSSQTTVLIVGLGAIGTRVARTLSAMDMRILGIRRHTTRPEPGVSAIFPLAEMDEHLPGVDAVILALPHTDETGVVLTRERLAKMKPGALVVNVARGSLIDEPALIEALQTGRIGGVGLDVFAREPLAQDNPLWTTPRTLTTPHTGAFDGDYWTPAIDLFFDNWRRFQVGEPLLNVVGEY